MKDAVKKRAVGYCRTSGEGQRDNTSIPVQKDCIEEFCQRNGWKFGGHYVDESKSGAKIAGRDAFQKMLKDAALGKFDVIVAYDVTRFARDGVDILNNAKFLRENFSVHVVDTKGSFDSRPGGNVLLNFVHAGVSEYERIKILERTTNGRIRKAQNGEPWSAHLPFGRGYDKNTKKWFITERGHRYRQLLERYVGGESFHELVTTDFPEFKSAQFANYIFRRSHITGTYKVIFKAEELNVSETVAVPAIPEIITAAFAKKVRDRMAHRRVCNKEDFRKYLLTGYVHCGHCGRFLSGTVGKGIRYHRHHGQVAGSKLCVFSGIREDEMLAPVLDYLFGFITDETAFNAAVTKALPDGKERPTLQHNRDELRAKVAQTELEIKRLVDAITKGADPAFLIKKQTELRERQEQESQRLAEVEERLSALPDQEVLKRDAMTIRLSVLAAVQDRDWRNMTYDQIRRYLIFVFGENPAKTRNGIHVQRDGRKWILSLKGEFLMPHDIVDGRPLSHCAKREAERHNKYVSRQMKERRIDVRNVKGITDLRETRTR
jgi:site-specific DNA recombinase